MRERVTHRNYKMAGLSAILFFLLIILPLTANHDPLHANAGEELAPPSTQYWLGTDHLGRDFWSRLVVGGQRTLLSAFWATGIAVFGGLILASLTQLGWRLNLYLARVLLDALLAFPILLVALVIRTLLAGSLLTLSVAIGLAGIALYANVARGALQSAQVLPHIEGAYSIGATPRRILIYHILPSALPTLVSFGIVLFGWMLLYQSALAFLGLGGDPSAPDWGAMLNQGRAYLDTDPLLMLCPSGMIALCIALVNQLSKTWLT